MAGQLLLLNSCCAYVYCVMYILHFIVSCSEQTIIKAALELTESLHTKNENESICVVVNCMKTKNEL